jgi:diguanylate cyclase (GGDEF)-like protein
VLALRDHVTGLGSRELFEEFLLVQIALARRQRVRFGLIYADVEQLDRVNALLGRDAGVALLRLDTARVRAALRASDPLARVGPDELAAILPEAGDHGAILVAEKVRRACVGWYEAQGTRHPLRVSEGSSVYPDEGDTSAALMRRAETAMYRIKVADRQIFGLSGRCSGDEYVLRPRGSP